MAISELKFCRSAIGNQYVVNMLRNAARMFIVHNNNNNIRLMIKLDKTRETLKFEVNIQETIYKVTVC
jgi:hypothetical protein